MEVRVKIEIQGSNGAIIKRLTIGVPDDITKKELIQGLQSQYPELVDENMRVFLEPGDNQLVSEKLLTDELTIILQPRSSSSFFRIIEE